MYAGLWPRGRPRVAQEGPGGPQDSPNTGPRGGARTANSSLPPQKAPKRPQEAPKRLPRGPKRPPREAQKRPKRGSHTAPRGCPHCFQEAHEKRPRRPRRPPNVAPTRNPKPQRGSKTAQTGHVCHGFRPCPPP
eukprot:3362155-Pyramimonas_sp.AAC.1